MTPDAPSQAGFLPYVVPPLIMGVWLLASFIISCLGWRLFAWKYPAKVRPTGRAYHAQWMDFGFLVPTYRHSVRVVFTEAGIYFYVVFLIRPFHAPFLLPWESIRGVEEEKLYLGKRYYRLDVEDCASKFEVLLPEEAGQVLFFYYLGINRRQRDDDEGDGDGVRFDC